MRQKIFSFIINSTGLKTLFYVTCKNKIYPRDDLDDYHTYKDTLHCIMVHVRSVILKVDVWRYINKF